MTDSNQARKANYKAQLLGKDGQPIRVLNFAGGGFDTVMQLGVSHALLVIQGRAPDAVVGVSAGAIQAAALAEIFQADDSVEHLKASNEKERYKQILEARVTKFREFVNACYRAPEKLLDAALPDAYQVDSRDPLQPLKLPRFARIERDSRQHDLIARSGLVHLYNDILNLDISVGTMARLVRRILGLRAANEIPSKLARWMVQSVEILRIWLLIGTDLRKLVPIVTMAIKPFFLKSTRARATTAGNLIFRFSPLQKALKTIRDSVFLFVLIALWVSFSMTILSIPYWPAKALVNSFPALSSYENLIVIIAFLSPTLVGLTHSLSQHDRETRWATAKDTIKALIVFVWLLVKWIAVYTLVFVLAVLVTWPLFQFLSSGRIGEIFILFGMLPIFIFSAVFILTTVLATIYANSQIFQRKEGVQSRRSFKTWYGFRFLSAYDLGKSIIHPHGVERFLADLFDDVYYGKLDIDSVVEDSLRDKLDASPRGNNPEIFKHRKVIGFYSATERKTPIKIGLAVADVSDGKLRVVAKDESIVRGLLYAVSVVPFLPAHFSKNRDRLFVDGTNVANVPMRALLDLLKNSVNPNSTVIHAYSVAPYPFSKPMLGKALEHQPVSGQTQPILNLLDIATRAIKLQRYRDSALERRLTELYTKAIPAIDPVSKKPRVTFRAGTQDGEKSDFYRIWVAPVELEEPTSLNKRILFAPKEKRREEIVRTIADGCRAAMQVMIADSIETMKNKNGTVKCVYAVRHHLRTRHEEVKKFTKIPLPGSSRAEDTVKSEDLPPGLSEICANCQLKSSVTDLSETKTQTLKWTDWKERAPSWPHEKESFEDSPGTDRHFVSKDSPSEISQVDFEKLIPKWPRNHKQDGERQRPSDRPTISLLFSGGVFRGVYQLGVLNALSELNVKPDIVAGASIGSITAAMSANALSMWDRPVYKKLHVARLAATYLAVDRIVLTDRFADFIRDLTIRAASTDFSVRQADWLFRKYDQPSPRKFDRGARQVIAGLERLFYISPFQLLKLTKSLRNRMEKSAARQFRTLIQQWLDRMSVGEEVLGAEPLKQLIQNYAVPSNHIGDPSKASLSVFKDLGIMFLATSTDLTDGRLITFGKPGSPAEQSDPILSEALLASSAFPGVFRPRWSTELFPNSNKNHQFIDGGVMDNLPIDAVIRFLRLVAQNKRIEFRPGSGVPHLLFSASLEVKINRISETRTFNNLRSFWPSLWARSKELGYNTKLDIYENAEKRLREIYESATGNKTGSKNKEKIFESLDINIVTVKPNWLCGTFAFHPMIGYSRARQAQSIAHGCASTLLRFANIPESYLAQWNIDRSRIPTAKDFQQAVFAKKNWGSYAEEDSCWLRPGRQCPFSNKALIELNNQIEDKTKHLLAGTIRELSKVHKCCSRIKTHMNQ